jgi:hypothetical protein
MNVIFIVLIFCMVLFIYIHVYFHIKTSNDLEMYEIEKPSKDKLEEICDLRQPVMFEFNNEKLNEQCNLNAIHSNYGAFDVKLRDLNNKDDESEMYIPITFKAASQLFQNDTNKKYITERNQDFLDETGLVKCYRYNDSFLRPYMVSNCDYDLVSASAEVTTPFKYDINYRNFYLVTQGKVRVKLSPPKSIKYLYPIYDYENFEFKSPVNPWNVQDEYKDYFERIKCLEFDLEPGFVLFIPSSWWYSFEFSDNTSLCSFKYRTYMNTVANIQHYVLKLLQSQNVKRNVANIKSFKTRDNENENKKVLDGSVSFATNDTK